MADTTWDDVDRYLTDLYVPDEPYFAEGLAAAEKAGLPAIQVSPPLGRLLELLARLGKARHILEVGTLGGYSTTWLARALPPGGSLVTLELDERHAEVARANLERAGFGDVVEVRVGPASQSLAALREEGAGPFDLVFIDADKTSYPDYFSKAMKLVAPGSVIVVDNVVRAGQVADASSSDANVVATRQMHELIAATPNVVATALQTVGVKGYDGITLAYVTA